MKQNSDNVFYMVRFHTVPSFSFDFSLNFLSSPRWQSIILHVLFSPLGLPWRFNVKLFLKIFSLIPIVVQSYYKGKYRYFPWVAVLHNDIVLKSLLATNYIACLIFLAWVYSEELKEFLLFQNFLVWSR